MGVRGKEGEQNAAYIVHACNAYPTLTARIDALVAERDALREGLEQCRAQFQFYADEHMQAGKDGKAATNQNFANIADALLSQEQTT
jgi:hypothetical protein